MICQPVFTTGRVEGARWNPQNNLFLFIHPWPQWQQPPLSHIRDVGAPCQVCLILVLTVLAVCKIRPFLGDRKNGGSTVGPGDIFPGKMMTKRTKPPWVSLSSCRLGRLSPGYVQNV